MVILQKHFQLISYYTELGSKVSAQFVYKLDTSCADPVGTEPLKIPSDLYIYPINVARNVARMIKGFFLSDIPSLSTGYTHANNRKCALLLQKLRPRCSLTMATTKNILFSNYEFIFSKNFEQQMIAVAEVEMKKHPKTVLVHRIFEVDESVKEILVYPRRKNALAVLLKEAKAVEFHSRYFKEGHTIPGLKEWLQRKLPDNKPSVDRVVAFIFKYTRKGWEPQLVSLTTIQFHDENFPYYCFDNTVLKWELCRHNYTFAVVSNVIMVYRGIKTSPGNMRKIQLLGRKQCSEATVAFNERMMKEHPETQELCPKI
ncbi:unnamed protein product [Enterobius vermicularis]|uniref:Uncharacterized protein n=1 Tax=Enterobius vermicularis TaxID=51028 RepID=A0A3P6HUH5_ENTVE|nr:unnamed protein product [Enterobius vermicularis]